MLNELLTVLDQLFSEVIANRIPMDQRQRGKGSDKIDVLKIIKDRLIFVLM